MNEAQDVRPEVGKQAAARLDGLPAAERESLLIRCWMSHDARWFNAVAAAFGLEAANRLNQVAAREIGRVEARRVARALDLPAAADADGYLRAQEAVIGLLGPDLLDYRLERPAADRFDIVVERCFAYDNVVRAGVAAGYDCGVFARIKGWLDALAPGYTLSPELGRCLKAQGLECRHQIAITAPQASAAPDLEG
jgi:hypothetical protein